MNEFDVRHPLRTLFPPPFDNPSPYDWGAELSDEECFRAAEYFELASKLVEEEFVKPDWDCIFELLYRPMHEFSFVDLAPDGTFQTWQEAYDRNLAEARVDNNHERVAELTRDRAAEVPMRDTPNGPRADLSRHRMSGYAKLTSVSQVTRAHLRECLGNPENLFGREEPEGSFDVLAEGHAQIFLERLPEAICRALQGKPLSERTVVRWLDVLERIVLSANDDNEQMLSPRFDSVDGLFNPVRSEHTHVIVPRLVDMAQRTTSQKFRSKLETRVRDYREHLDGADGFL